MRNFRNGAKAGIIQCPLKGGQSSDLLNHIYVLIPVLDSEKHYWVGETKLTSCFSMGKGGLLTILKKN